MQFRQSEHIFRSPRSAFWLLTICLGILAGLAKGYLPHGEDWGNFYHLIRRAIDSNYAPVDFFLNENFSFGPRKYFAHFVAAFATLETLPAVCQAINLFIFVVMAVATAGIARTWLSASPLAALISIPLILFAEKPTLGGYGEIIALSPSTLSFTFGLLTFWSLVHSRYVLSAICTIPSVLFHPHVAILFVGVFYLMRSIEILAVDRADVNGTRPDRKIGELGLGIAVYLGSLVLVWIVPAAQYPRIPSAMYLDIAARIRAPHHLDYGSFPISDYIGTTALLISIGFCLLYLRQTMQIRRAQCLGISVGIGALITVLALSFTLTEIIPHRLGAQLGGIRTIILLRWIGYLLLAGVLAHLSQRNWFYRLWALSLCIAIIYPPLLGVGLVLRALAQLIRDRYCHPSASYILLALFAMLVAYTGFHHTFQRFEMIMIVCSCFFLLLADRRWKRLLPLLFCGLSAAILAAFLSDSLVVPIRSGSTWFQRISYTAFAEKTVKALPEIESIGEIIREETPQDAHIVTPPMLNDLTKHAARAIFVNFRLFPLTDMGMLEWRERLEILAGPLAGRGFPLANELNQRYKRITDRQLLGLRGKYGVTHAVLYSQTSTRLPITGRTRSFTLVEITGDAFSGSN